MRDIAFNPTNGNQAVSGSYCADPHTAHPNCDGNLILWDIARRKKKQVLDGHTTTVTAVAFSPNGYYMVSGSGDRTMIYWDMRNLTEVRTFGPISPVNDVAFSPDGQQVLSGHDDPLLRLWDVNSAGSEPRIYVGHTDPISAVSFSHDGRFALSGAEDALRVWDIESGDQIVSFVGHSGRIQQAIFVGDGQMILAWDMWRDDTLRLWKLPPDALDGLVDWILENRYVRELTCDERAFYRVEPMCAQIPPD
ncbi:MAG: WD40 repeat domain-containing protein [Caldilineaceae bacterium]|nr:WD40 repeat domain-containing protein [Caldilineaceae bacterium]